MSEPLTWWFPISELKAAVDEIAARYPDAHVGRNRVSNISFTTGPNDDDPVAGVIDLGPVGPRADYWDDEDEVDAG